MSENFSLDSSDDNPILGNQLVVMSGADLDALVEKEELQDFDGSCFDVFADDVGTLLVAQITIFVIAATIGTGQSCQRLIFFFCPSGPTSKRRQKMFHFTILEEINAISGSLNVMNLRSQQHRQIISLAGQYLRSSKA